MISEDKLPTLVSKRLHLRWLEDRDGGDLYAIFSDPVVMRFWSSPPWTDVSEAGSFIDRVRDSFANDTLYQWGVAHRDDDRVMGTCTLASLDWQNRRAEVGFALRQDAWGKGHMYEAVSRLLRFAFEGLELHRIEADVDPRNEASIRLLKRLGFQKEGYLRERWLVGGEVNDTVLFGLLSREWSIPQAGS